MILNSQELSKTPEMKEIHFVVDAQGFRDNNGAFILKELAIKWVHSDQLEHNVVHSAVPWFTLNEEKQKEAMHNATFIHGISWTDGDAELKRVRHMARVVTVNAFQIWAKGHEKCIFLRQFFNTMVYDLERTGCPKASDLPYNGTFEECPMAAHKSILWQKDHLTAVLKFKCRNMHIG